MIETLASERADQSFVGTRGSAVARGKIVTRFTGAMNVSFDANITNLIEISGRAGCSGYCRRQPSSG